MTQQFGGMPSLDWEQKIQELLNKPETVIQGLLAGGGPNYSPLSQQQVAQGIYNRQYGGLGQAANALHLNPQGTVLQRGLSIFDIIRRAQQMVNPYLAPITAAQLPTQQMFAGLKYNNELPALVRSLVSFSGANPNNVFAQWEQAVPRGGALPQTSYQ